VGASPALFFQNVGEAPTPHKNTMPVKLDSVVPWGRSFDEYVRMFALTQTDLQCKILDCAAGPSSFNAEMRQHGHRVISVDPIYAFSPGEIRSRVEAVRNTMIDQVRGIPDQFVWNYIRSPEHLMEVRMKAMALFLTDYETDTRRERYQNQSLPNLEFADGSFDLALCSHCLFLYSEQFDTKFHVESILQLLRVAREVRIFPVTDLSGKASAHLQQVQKSFASELVTVPYEFLRGANQMLAVKSPRHASDPAHR
jgi:hypothetical protein